MCKTTLLHACLAIKVYVSKVVFSSISTTANDRSKATIIIIICLTNYVQLMMCDTISFTATKIILKSYLISYL